MRSRASRSSTAATGRSTGSTWAASAYAAAYATYLWSNVIAADIRSGFSNGLMDIADAHRYRDQVLAPGGNIPAADAVANFLGRPYNSNAFKERLAKSG